MSDDNTEILKLLKGMNGSRQETENAKAIAGFAVAIERCRDEITQLFTYHEDGKKEQDKFLRDIRTEIQGFKCIKEDEINNNTNAIEELRNMASGNREKLDYSLLRKEIIKEFKERRIERIKLWGWIMGPIVGTVSLVYTLIRMGVFGK